MGKGIKGLWERVHRPMPVANPEPPRPRRPKNRPGAKRASAPYGDKYTGLTPRETLEHAIKHLDRGRIPPPPVKPPHFPGKPRN